MNKITVIGIGFRPLEEASSEILRNADVVLSNSRLTDVFKTYREYGDVRERIIVHATVYDMMDYIAENYESKKIALLAAGDPMFFGIGRLAVERFGRDAVEVFPDLSSLQVAFSRVRETSNNAFLVSLHGGPDPEKRRRLEYEISDIPDLLERHGKLAILTDKVNSPEKIAETLRKGSGGRGQGLEVKMYVCEKLGYPDERVFEGSVDEAVSGNFEHPNVVIVKKDYDREDRTQEEPTSFQLGLQEFEIQHSKGLITKDEVRAVSLHKLRLPSDGVLWDIGAGSGSVSIEAGRMCAGLKVYALERNDERLGLIESNKKKFRLDNMQVISGSAPDSMAGLPVPDRVFIGGSAGRMQEIVGHISEKMNKGIIVINSTTIETLSEAITALKSAGYEIDISEVTVARSKGIAGKTHMSALNPVFVIRGVRQ